MADEKHGMTNSDHSVTAACHCQAVRIEIDCLPDTVTSCNCSICRRYGALWAYRTHDQVRLRADPSKLRAYSWGDRTIEFWHCTECGCLTHYVSTDRTERERFAVNARMLPLDVMESLTVRRFDGADSWAYLD